ncbi:tetratricopeptide repeat protein [Synechococcus sp. MU1642]|uniref:tetratricopeptide repeat protein n=1 Tax=Synechococcus sp. MU1642 TaxID=2508348 RepID=UPI001CF82213|nr:tetratricopeptide repeat protein [Synechococcus sp. MU1642]
MEDIKTKALQAHSEGRLVEAEFSYRILLEQGDDPDVAVNLGALLRSQRRLREGSSHYHRCLKRMPGQRKLILNACNCWRETGESAAALHWLRHALNAEPTDTELRESLAETLAMAGETAEAIVVYEAIVQSDTSRIQSWMGLGLIHARAEKLEESKDCYRKVLSINPDQPHAKANLLTILKQQGEFQAAQTLVDSLSKFQQKHPDIRKAVADLRMAEGDCVTASHILAELAGDSPGKPEHWLNWAASLKSLKFTVAPALILKRGLQYNPNDNNLWLALEQALCEMCNLEAARKICAFRGFDTDIKSSEQLFNRQFLSLSQTQSDELCERRLEWAKHWEDGQKKKSYGPLWPDLLLEPHTGRRLRIGYLSADFCNHPVGRFLLPILKNHDCNDFEIWGINCGHHHDWVSEHLKEHCDHWLDCKFHNDALSARLIADLRLDVLVELGGYTSGSRIGILVHRPAPIQLSYLGFPAPTYLKCIDGWLGDKVLFDGLSQVDNKAHRLINIEGGYMVFDPCGTLPLPVREPCERFRFGSFNHARKLSDASIDLFCAVMSSCPNAELILKSISFHEAAEKNRIRSRFKKAGLATDRLILLDWIEGGINHLQLYRHMDVALDPIPYGGATTTAEAMWMGVPVVSMRGEGMVGRLSASLLHYAGCERWVANNNDQFVNIAKNLESQGPRTSKKRLQLRKILERSKLADGARLSSELEKIYKTLRQDINPY